MKKSGLKSEMLVFLWILILDICTIKAESNTCTKPTPHRLLCTKHPPSLDEKIYEITILELQNIQQDEIDLATIIIVFPNLTNVTIHGGNLYKINPPHTNNKIKVLGLVDIGVENIGNLFLANFPNLEILDLRGNYLQSFSNNKLGLPKLRSLYLADNKWNCSLELDWVLRLDRNLVKDLDNLTCFGNPHPKKSLTTIAHFMKDLRKHCPNNCLCSLPKVVFKNMESEQLEPVIEVNCSHKGLTELPSNLPKQTKIVRLEGNEIEDLRPLKHDPIYRKTLELYLDNNKVNSIEELEGSYWLKHFRVLSLSGNKLSEIPTYALDNALETNTNMPNAVRLSLGGNPWRCDCVFTPVFKEMLQKFANQIQDIHEVKCSYVEGDENSLLPIVELSRSSVCRSPSEYSVQALDLLNAVLASLILLILGKLAYDYYYFKKTGRLPWIVTKMP